MHRAKRPVREERTTMTDATTPEIPTPETSTEAVDALGRLRADLREAGENGKRQWQEALGRTRDALASTRAELTKLSASTREATLATYARAERRGADLLLRLAGQVRVHVEAFEAALRPRAAGADQETAGASA
ncbi:MAG: hypothetical protein M9894_37245 [Planctomycetes bacterium]|nr:hypothetical protein [Planctomycetota bacterium]